MSDQQDLNAQRDQLSAAKRALLEKRLRGERVMPDSRPLHVAQNLSSATGPADLRAEVTLDAAIYPADRSVRAGLPGQILLTGATGFLGAFLLRELLEQTTAMIFCLVRCRDLEQGRARIEQVLQSYGLQHLDWRDRVMPLPGDLAQPLLGLSEQQFGELAQRVEAIYHCGAMVNNVAPYATLKPSNVDGTHEVLRLACQTTAKPLHLISTLSVFPRSQTLLAEDDTPELEVGVTNGYTESKWVAEQLALAARSRGLPVTVYRPGSIAGDSQTGALSPKEFMFSMIKGCIQLGAIPDLPVLVDMTPIDYVSKVIVYLSLQPASRDKVFHPVNPELCTMGELGDMLRSYGYTLATVPYAEWRARLLAAVAQSDTNALFPFVSLFLPAEIAEQLSRPRSLTIDCRNTTAALSGTSIVYPPLDAELLKKYIDYLVRTDFLTPPDDARVA
ncbi:MAG: thioester reductase domain-containing protein [Chloroflexi bacterium]|nr:thioester reductase domain-containing protein [Chloroflexota bacterium]